jgi:hypothetical protein
MPNFVLNSITITHNDPKCIDRIIRGFEGGALFTEFIPEPYDLEKEGRDILEVPTAGRWDKMPVEIAPEIKPTTVKLPRWYTWRNEHWGTKWDVGARADDYPPMDATRVDDNEVQLLIATAWTPPLPIFTYWIKMGYRVFASMDDENGCFALVFANGWLTEVPVKTVYELLGTYEGPDDSETNVGQTSSDKASSEQQRTILERYDRTGQIDVALVQLVWKPAAENGNADAQFNLGIANLNGLTVARDLEEAKKWFRLAAAQGHAKAERKLTQL